MEHPDKNIMEIPGDSMIRNPDFGKKILKKIHAISKELKEPVKLMHICGTHEHTLAEHGLRSPEIIPKNVDIKLRQTPQLFYVFILPDTVFTVILYVKKRLVCSG